jgi:hypothetical protein
MSKPIFVVRFPGYWKENQVNSSRKSIYDNKPLNEDYHVLVVKDNDIEAIKFEIFNSPHEPEKLGNITKLIELSIQRCVNQETVKYNNQSLNKEYTENE